METENEIAQLEARVSILEDQIQLAMAVANQAQMMAESASNR
jgi:uncharacterized coiled-coil protein SlyX